MAITEHAVAFALCWRSGVIATKYQGQIEIRKPVWLTVAVKIEILEGTGQAGSKILFQSGVQSTESGTAQHPQTTGVIFSDRLCKANSQQMIANPQRRARRIIVAVKSNQPVEITAVIELKIVELQLRIFGKLPEAHIDSHAPAFKFVSNVWRFDVSRLNRPPVFVENLHASSGNRWRRNSLDALSR